MSEQLTVKDITEQLKIHCPGAAFHADNKTHAELIANRFMDFTATLIGELETITEEHREAVKQLTIMMDDERSASKRVKALTADLDTSEDACADLMTLNTALFDRCKIVFYPTTAQFPYPIEHNMAANKDSSALIVEALKDTKEVSDGTPKV